MLVYFRKRIDQEIIEKINREIVNQSLKNEEEKTNLSEEKKT